MDNDKDKLLNEIDEKTIENVTFKQELTAKHRRIDELNSQLAQLDSALNRTNDNTRNLQAVSKLITQKLSQTAIAAAQNSNSSDNVENKILIVSKVFVLKI